jgi:hypothetical protein
MTEYISYSILVREPAGKVGLILGRDKQNWRKSTKLYVKGTGKSVWTEFL